MVVLPVNLESDKLFHFFKCHDLIIVEKILKSTTDPNLLMTPMLTPEYSLTCRSLIKSESIETCSTKPTLLNHIVIYTSVDRNPI